MAWRWYKRLRLFGGLNANLSSNGPGWSWGIGFIRFGVSPNGRRWVSVEIPETGFGYFKYLKNNSNSNQRDHIEEDMIVEEHKIVS
jgi:Protein of unknown function (DUF4236)